MVWIVFVWCWVWVVVSGCLFLFVIFFGYVDLFVVCLKWCVLFLFMFVFGIESFCDEIGFVFYDM